MLINTSIIDFKFTHKFHRFQPFSTSAPTIYYTVQNDLDYNFVVRVLTALKGLRQQ